MFMMYFLVTLVVLTTIWSIAEQDKKPIGWYDVRRAAQKGQKVLILPDLLRSGEPYMARFVLTHNGGEVQIKPRYHGKWLPTDAIYEVNKIDDELLTWIRECHEAMDDRQ